MNNIGSPGLGIEAKPTAQNPSKGSRMLGVRLGSRGQRLAFGTADITQAKARLACLTILSGALGLATVPAHPAAGPK